MYAKGRGYWRQWADERLTLLYHTIRHVKGHIQATTPLWLYLTGKCLHVVVVCVCRRTESGAVDSSLPSHLFTAGDSLSYESSDAEYDSLSAGCHGTTAAAAAVSKKVVTIVL